MSAGAVGSRVFLSTPSARRATPAEGGADLVHVISIHALREEGDVATCFRKPMMPNFYPRPPRGGRRLQTLAFTSFLIFLSTPSARRATKQLAAERKAAKISIHALREEGD